MTQGSSVSLDSICNVEYGTRVVQKRDGGSIYPVYGGGGATFKMDVFNRQNRLVVARFAMSEVCARFVSGPFYLNDSGLTVSPKGTNLTQKFLDYQLLSKSDEIYALGKGSAQRNLDVPAFRELLLFVPKDIESQQRIVDILDAAFAEIATAKSNAEKNLQNARALFESYLNKVFIDGGESWQSCQLADLCEIKHGYAFDGTDFSSTAPEGNPIVITPGNFTEDGKLLFSEKNTKRLTGKVPEAYRFNEGDLVVVMTDLSSKMKILGKPAFVESKNILHNQRIGRVIFSSGALDKRFVYYFMMSKAFLQNIRATATGTMVRHTAPSRILSNVICFPSELRQQITVVEKLDALLSETRHLESIYQQKLAALDELKKSLLHQAFSGAL